MKKNYIRKYSKNGEFSPSITKENNVRLSLYCEINNINKTAYVNKLIEEDMKKKFEVLKNE